MKRWSTPSSSNTSPSSFLSSASRSFSRSSRAGLLLLDRLDDVAVSRARVSRRGRRISSSSYSAICSRRNSLLVLPRHADPLEAGVRDDDRVPVAGGDLGGQSLAPVLREVLLAGDEQLGVRVELQELAGELLEQVVGDDEQRLLDQPRLLHLHGGRGHLQRLPGPDDVGQQRVARRSCPARRRPSGAAAGSIAWLIPGKSPGASRRTAGAGGCCRCRCKAAPAARCGRGRRRPRP